MIHSLFSGIDSLIFTGGEFPLASMWQPMIQPNTTIIAADSGLHQLENITINIDHIVGDFDSLNNAKETLKLYPHAIIHQASISKDETDTELALLLAKKLKCKSTALVGGGEGRLDHLLAIVQLFSHSLAPSFWMTAREYIIPITTQKPFNYQLPINTQISFYPIVPSNYPIITEGLRWPFDHFDHLHSRMSLSNLTEKKSIKVNVKNGIILAIVTYD